MEVAIKVIANGFIINGPRSYMQDNWQVIDFVIVVTSLISIITEAMYLSSVKVIRMIRLLRPLRLISKSENLRVSI